MFTSSKGLLYCAPEVGHGNSTGYGPKADMWSLGVMMLQLMFGLPHIPSLPPHGHRKKSQEWVDHWSRRLRSEFYSLTGKNAQMASILIDLIQIDPKKRFTAHQCLQRGLDINLFKRNEESQIVLQNTEAVDTSTSEVWQINFPCRSRWTKNKVHYAITSFQSDRSKRRSSWFTPFETESVGEIVLMINAVAMTKEYRWKLPRSTCALIWSSLGADRKHSSGSPFATELEIWRKSAM